MLECGRDCSRAIRDKIILITMMLVCGMIVLRMRLVQRPSCAEGAASFT